MFGLISTRQIDTGTFSRVANIALQSFIEIGRYNLKYIILENVQFYVVLLHILLPFAAQFTSWGEKIVNRKNKMVSLAAAMVIFFRQKIMEYGSVEFKSEDFENFLDAADNSLMIYELWVCKHGAKKFP